MSYLLHIDARAHAFRIRRVLVAVLAIVVASTTVVVGTARRAGAAPLFSTPVITFNMQGATSGGDSKWTTTVGAYARAAELVALQEVGPRPPGDLVANIVFDPNAPGNSGFVQHHRWLFGHESYEVYFLQTDANGGTWSGGRNNIAILTHRAATQVHVITNPNGRDALGVRMDNTWYFTFHGQSLAGRPNDSADMTQRIADFVSQVPGMQWTVLGDFNMEPEEFDEPAQSHWYNSGLPTQQSGRELDYALSSENLVGHPVLRLPGSSPDHYAVAVGAMRAAANPPELRILPLGDSITYGAGSSAGAYRGTLWDELRHQTNTTVNYVGSQHYGAIPDNDNEGHPGWTIADIAGITDSVLSTYQPNVVLLHIGTNDMNGNVDVAHAPDRLGGLIDQIFRAQPDVTLLVSTLVPSTDPTVEGRIFNFNNTIPDLVEEKQYAGKRVWMVDMAPVTTADLADYLHPNDTGFQKMGEVFYHGIQSVEWAGWVTPPPDSENPGGGPVTGWLPQGSIATGTFSPGSYPGSLTLGSGDQAHLAEITGDGQADYLVTHPNGVVDQWTNGGLGTDGTIAWISHRRVTRFGIAADARWQFPDLNGDGIAEVVQVNPAEGTVFMFRADGSLFRDPLSGITFNPSSQHLFADVTGDGLADWLEVRADSSVTARTARSPGGPFDDVGTIATGVGVPGSHIRFADVDGNGMADYLVQNDDSSVRAWINGGPGGSIGYLWFPEGTIATGVGVPGSRVQFVDVDGDRRADYLDVNPANGATRMWRNVSTPEDGWLWFPYGLITGSAQRAIYADINGDRRADYLQINADSSVRAWLNGGPQPAGENWFWYPQGTIASGVGVPGVNIRFADINGDGREDYLDVNPTTGATRAWINGGAQPAGENWFWYPQGTIASGVGVPGVNIRFADLNGDHRADYLAVNANSSVRAWVNGGPQPAGENWFWYPQGTIASGVGAAAANTRFADLTGDRRADYLFVHDNSSVDMWLNGGPQPAGENWFWYPQGTIAAGVVVPGSQIQFADLDADGREDYLDVNPTTGATRAWINVG